MEIKGKIIAVLPEVSGTSSKGNSWKKRDYVLENTEGQFPRRVAFTCFGENADKIQLSVGQEVNMYFDIDSREWNGRWYTDIRCWRCDILDGAAAAAPAAAAPAAAPGAVPPPPAMPASDTEFPF